MLSVICENYNALQNHVMRLMSENPAKVFNASKKRKAESIDDSQKRERKQNNSSNPSSKSPITIIN